MVLWKYYYQQQQSVEQAQAPGIDWCKLTDINGEKHYDYVTSSNSMTKIIEFANWSMQAGKNWQ